jgi:arylsulfatase A-like enzyme
MFQDEGYINGHFGKWHLNKDKKYEGGRPGDPESQGFHKDEILTTVKPKADTDPYSDPHHSQEITARSLDFIKRHKDEKFFCYVAYHAVHRPLIEEPDLVAKYEAKEGADLDVNNPIMGAMIERMDTGIGQILTLLEDLEIDDKTIIVFYSDNGGLEFLQDQAPLRGGKATIWEGGIRVPLAINWPGVVAENQDSRALVTSDDFFPTFAEIFGRSSEGYDGVSLLPLLTGEGDFDRETLYFHYPHYHHLGYRPASAVRMGDYKLIEWYEQSLLKENGEVSLFNLRKDIGESNDLSAEMPEKVKEMRSTLHAWRKAIDAQEMSVNPNYDPERASLRFPEE